MQILAQATRTWDGGVVLRFPYNPGLIERLKASIPSDRRSWDPTLKVWTVLPPYAHLGVDLLRAAFPDATVSDAEADGAPPRPEPIRPTDGLYGDLHLLPSAPPALVTAAYRVLARLHHPDAGGDTATMQRINAAHEALKLRGAA